MTVIRHGGKLALHSAVPPSQELLAEIAKLGEVSWLLAPNLQHWLFLPAWLAAFPSASVGLAPPALGESLTSKMPHLANHKGAVGLLGQPEVMAKLEEEMGLIGRHLQGAPLNLNEYLFYHDTSGTMIASDSFYGGYAAEETPSWFARLWFKLTRRGSFRTARLPIYRTSRVVTHGDPKTVMASAGAIMASFGPVTRIIFAHGTSPFTEDQLECGRAGMPAGWKGPGGLKGLYLSCWRDGLVQAGAPDSATGSACSCSSGQCCSSAFCTDKLCISNLG